jgi:hypothetical protein
MSVSRPGSILGTLADERIILFLPFHMQCQRHALADQGKLSHGNRIGGIAMPPVTMRIFSDYV